VALIHTLDGSVGTLFYIIVHSKSYEQHDYPDESEYQVYPFDPIRNSLGFVTQNSPCPEITKNRDDSNNHKCEVSGYIKQKRSDSTYQYGKKSHSIYSLSYSKNEY
jgi:hypothetical protein